jgi:hypothetical protein
VPPKYGVRLPCWVIALGAIVLYTSEVAIAESPAERRGLRFARLHRAPCHAIDRVGESPLPHRRSARSASSILHASVPA